MSNENFLVDFISKAMDEFRKRTEKPASVIPEKLTATEKKLAEMFMEHVPTNILDSGGHYGYRYQGSRKNPEWEKLDHRVEFDTYSDGELSLYTPINTFRHLADQLFYIKEWDDKFQEWRKQFEEEELGWNAHLDEFLHPDTGEVCKDSGWCSGYTYNYETLLDRDIVFYWYDNIVILEVHNGCDARWGFTDPVLFNCEDYFDYGGRATIECTECHAFWDYYPHGCEYAVDRNNESIKSLEKYPCEQGESGKVGVLVINKDHEGFCPCCGKGKIK